MRDNCNNSNNLHSRRIRASDYTENYTHEPTHRRSRGILPTTSIFFPDSDHVCGCTVTIPPIGSQWPCYAPSILHLLFSNAGPGVRIIPLQPHIMVLLIACTALFTCFGKEKKRWKRKHWCQYRSTWRLTTQRDCKHLTTNPSSHSSTSCYAIFLSIHSPCSCIISTVLQYC